MRELRYLGPGEDDSVVLSDSDSGEEFRLIVDDKLSAAIRPDAPEQERDEQLPGGEEAVIELRPRDIQMRVRGGEDPQTLAAESGIPIEKVMRFAYPVLAERLRVVDEARRSRTRSADGQTVGFGELFDARVAALGTEPQTVTWDSFRRPDGGWTVTAVFTARTFGTDDTELAARFTLALGNRTVSAMNETAADLLSGNPIKALQPPPPPEPEFGPPTLIAVPAVDDAEAERTDEGAVDSADIDTDDSSESRPDQRTSRLPIRLSSRRQKAHTHPIPVPLDEEMYDELFDQEALDPVGDGDWQATPLPFDLPAESDTSGRSDTIDAPEQPVEEPVASDASDPAEATPQPEQPAAQPRRSRSGEKPRMPSWDDILLGVRRKSE